MKFGPPEIDPTSLVVPGATVLGNVTLQAEVVVLFGAVIRAEMDRITIGSQTNIQDNVSVHCDEGAPAQIGSRVTVGHNAVVHGATIGDSALIGIGSLALNRSSVGEGAWLAAGAVLPEGKSIPPWTLAMGTPAKPVRELTEDEVRRADDGVGRYLSLLAAYREIFT